MKNYRYIVTENPFHGGDEIIRTNSLNVVKRTLAKAMRWERENGCTCGGPRVLDTTTDEVNGYELMTALQRI